jgi:hypothetical protein
MSWAIVAGSAIIGGAGLLSAYIYGESAKKAAATEAGAAEKGIEAVQEQFTGMQDILSPYVQAGNSALEQQQNLAGLGGPAAQQSAIQAISSGPEFQALTQQGENAILQQSAATGGLRGGNVQGALAQFRPQLLSSLINQQYGRLGGLTQIGQASAAGVGAAGMQTGTNVSNLLAAQGAATAGGQLAMGQAYSQVPQQFVQGGLVGYGLKNPGAF